MCSEKDQKVSTTEQEQAASASGKRECPSSQQTLENRSDGAAYVWFPFVFSTHNVWAFNDAVTQLNLDFQF